MARRQASKEERKSITEYLGSISFTDLAEKKGSFEIEDNVAFFEGKPVVLLYEGKIFPTLKLILEKGYSKFKTVTVDMGAVKFVANGADIMRPGIRSFSPDISKGDFAVVIDENHKKPLAVGVSLLSSQELETVKTGKAVKNIHYVGDKIWNL